MSKKYYSIPTEIGLAAITNASMEGKRININHFAVGDGNGEYYNPEPSAVSLKNETWRGNITNCEIDAKSKNIINVTAVIPSDIGGFTIREMGVFDENNQLIAIANCPDTGKAAIIDGVLSELEVTIQIILTHTDVVKFEVDPTVILASKADVTKLKVELLNEYKNHTQNGNIHVSNSEKEKWNKSVELATKNKDDINNVNQKIKTDINNVNKKIDIAEEKSLVENTKIKDKLESIAVYNAIATYSNGIYDLTLDNPPTILPTNYTVNFNAPTSVKKGDKVRVGENIVNLMGKGFNEDIATFLNYDGEKLQNGFIRIEASETAVKHVLSKALAKDFLKNDTNYTVVVDLLSNSNRGVEFSFSTSKKSPFMGSVTVGPNGEKGLFKTLVKTKQQFSDTEKLISLMTFKATGTLIFRIMLLEGDWTNRDLPCEYWENTFGEYPILTYGENSPQVEDNAFIKGQPITLNVGLTGAFFKSGGGGGGSLPSTWLEKSNGIAEETIKKDDAIIRMKYGNMDNAISLADVSGINADRVIENVAWSHDGKWLALRNGNNYIFIYRVDGDIYTRKNIMVSNSFRSFSFAQASNYFVVLKSDNTFEYYSFDDNDFTLISTTLNATRDIDTGAFLDIQLNPDGTEVFTSCGNGIKAFKINADGKSFGEMAMPAYNSVRTCQTPLSKDGMYLMAFSRDTTSGWNYKHVYKKINGTWNSINFFNDLSNVSIITSAIHPTCNYLFAGGTAGGTITPIIHWYKNDGQDNFIKMPQPTIAPPKTIQSLEVSPCGNYLIVGGASYLYIYKIENDTLVKMPNPSEMPESNTYKNSIKFKNDGSKLTIGMTGTPFLHIYQTEAKTSIKKLDSLDLANRLATNKLLELGVGKADTNADINQNCNVTLIKGINEHLGGIYA